MSSSKFQHLIPHWSFKVPVQAVAGEHRAHLAAVAVAPE
jgi:hypothetical protein